MHINDEQVERYSRQIILPEIGGRGQERLLDSSVAVVGSGHAAWITTSYLAGAGVGHIDVVATDPGAASALGEWTDEIGDLNPGVRLQATTRPESLGDGGAKWAESYDVMVGVCDRESLRPVATAARQARRPIIAGGAFGSTGWFCVSAGSSSQEACVLCVERAAQRVAADDRDSPLAAVTGAVVGSLIAIETSKQLLGMETPDGWFSYDARRATLARRSFMRLVDCPVCGAEVRS